VLTADDDANSAGNSYYRNVKIFEDGDGDLACDIQCTPGTACNDNDACTTGEAYDSGCNCVGGTIVDTDGDNVLMINVLGQMAVLLEHLVMIVILAQPVMCMITLVPASELLLMLMEMEFVMPMMLVQRVMIMQMPIMMAHQTLAIVVQVILMITTVIALVELSRIAITIRFVMPMIFVQVEMILLIQIMTELQMLAIIVTTQQYMCRRQ